MDTEASEIRWNSKQQFMIQDYFTANNRFGFCNSGNGQVRMFMSNSHTPSNILFSKALTDTTYVDLMKIAYSGWCLYRAQRLNQRYNGCSGRRWCWYKRSALCGSEFRRLNNNERDHNDLWYDFNRNDIYTDTLMEQPPQRIT
jgi:hypothetical protein